jgi:hypothetical protein
MSGIGHLAPGFLAKSVEPKAPLWVFLAAGETNDLLYFGFTATGIEKPSTTSMNFTEGVRYLTQGSIPWSHGLFMSVIWSAAIAGIAYLVWRSRRVSALLGGVALSHWILDFLMHSNLPLFFDGPLVLGLGLENSGQGFLFMTIFDLVFLAVGIFIYFRARKKRKQGDKNEVNTKWNIQN